MTFIANPMYDFVFLFLMEDERVAKVLLSALLKQEVHDLEMCCEEHIHRQQVRVSLFRLCFTARIKDAAGREQQVLIELLKTWIPTKTRHFRQYLGAQCQRSGYLTSDEDNRRYGLPVISIYILGHRVGNLQEPVVYVKRRYLDYESKEIKEGGADPFIESLTHDSIIIQIPCLNVRACNPLERLLSIFDQSCRVGTDAHLLLIDDEHMDMEGRPLVKRLIMAAASPDVRREMRIEDEILSEIEDRDTKLMQQDKEIERLDNILRHFNH